MITVLAGGTGSVKLVRGLVAQESKVNVITNVGDNYWLYGLYVCPDIDTIIYGLADLLDQERGWGIKKDTFNFLRQMEVFGEETWFRVGDRDAATHLIRTNMLKNGKNLSDITKWMCEKFAVSANIIPVTDNSIETRIITDKGELHLQEYWVKHRGRDKVEGIQYIGADKARPNPEAVNLIRDPDMVILEPGNPHMCIMNCIYCFWIWTCFVCSDILNSFNFVSSAMFYPIFLKMQFSFVCDYSCFYAVICNWNDICTDCKFLTHPFCNVTQIFTVFQHVCSYQVSCSISVSDSKPCLF